MDISEVRRAVMPTVDGIRGHRVTTPEEDELMHRSALEMLDSLAPLPAIICMIPACGCSGEAHS